MNRGPHPYGRGMVGVSLSGQAGAPDPRALGNFRNAQGGNPTVIQGGGMRGGRNILGFPVVTLIGAAANGTTQAISKPQGLWRTDRCIIVNTVDSTGASLAIASILVGSVSCFANSNSATSAAFLPTSVDCGLTLESAEPAIDITVNYVGLTVASTTSNTIVTTMLGAYVQGGGREISG